MVCGDQKYIYPADFFHPDYRVQEIPLLNKYFFKVTLPLVASATLVIANIAVKKPWYTAIHRHFIALPGTFAFACWFDKTMDEKAAKRDAITYNYIITHPEDFPPIERVKYKDCLDKWHPKRFR